MQAYRYLQTFLILVCAATLISCTTITANSFYEKQDYYKAIKTVTNSLDKEGKYPQIAQVKQKWLTLISDSINSIENFPNDTLNNKIKKSVYIHDVRLLLENKFYQNDFSEFVQRYPLDQLKINIAELYYTQGNQVQLNYTADYKTKSDAYFNGLKYAEYKDMRKLAEKYKKEYITRSAEDAYQLGKQYAAAKNYKEASQYFKNARNIYIEYGSYKDSAALFTKYDKMWRTEEAESYYSQGNNTAQSANRKYLHRKASSYYNLAYDIYKPYGTYKNSVALSNKEWNLGKVTIDYSICCGLGSDLNAKITNEIKDVFSKNYYRLSSSGADIKILISFSDSLNQASPSYDRKALVLNKEDGSSLHFTKTVKTIENQYKGVVRVRVTGAFSYDNNDVIYESSKRTETYYQGNVPSGYKSSSSGKLKTQADFRYSIRYNIASSVNKLLKDVHRETENL